MSPQEREYNRERAAVERSRAAQATSERAADIHHTLACLYEKLIEMDQSERPTLAIITPSRLSA